MGKRVQFIMPKSEKKQLLTQKRAWLVMGIVAILGVLTAAGVTVLESTLDRDINSPWVPIVGAIVAIAIVELLFKKWRRKDQDNHSAKHSEHT